MAVLILGAIAFYLSYRMGTGHFAESFALLVIAGGVMYAPYGPYCAFIPELLPQNVSGAAMGVINAFGALGGFAGAYSAGVLGGGTKSGAAFIFMAASLLAAGLLMFLVKRPPTYGRAGCQLQSQGRSVRPGVHIRRVARPTGRTRAGLSAA